MYKVLVWGMTNNPGGVESVIMNYYRNISKDVCQFTFLCNTKEVAYENEILARGDKIIRIPIRREHFFKFYKELNNVFKQDKYDAVWANVCSLSNIECLKMAKRYGVKTRIVHSHNSKNMGSMKSAILHAINKMFVHNYATDFWACGELAGKYFYKDRILNSDKYKIIKNAVDLKKFEFNEEIRTNYRKELGIDDKLVFGHVGRFHFQKNHKFLIDVFYEIQKQRNDAILLLIGQGEDENKVKQQVQQLGIENKVKFLGIRSDVNNLLQTFDLMIFPSLFEGLSVALLEAQATGMPIFAADTISPETKINDNFVFLPLNNLPKDWADYIVKELPDIYREKNACENLRKNGFDINTQIKNFIDLIKND